MSVIDASSVALPESLPRRGPVRFQDRGGLFALLLKNAVLTLITLGIYRFWARAALRRYWWGSIVISGDPLEYTGTGLELFIGFLMFLGIMLPLALVYGLTSLLAATNLGVGAVLHVGEMAVFFILIQFVVFRARRYRLSRTLWRGVRASQGGTSWEYLRLVIGWSLLSAITLGIAAPWARLATTRYLMNRTALGNLEARFDGRGRDLVVAWLVPYVLMFGSIASFLVLNIGMIGYFGPEVMPRGIWLVFLGYFSGGLGFLAYLFAELRYTIRRTRFGEVQLGSTLKIPGMVFSVVGFIILLMIALIVVVCLVVAVIGPHLQKAAPGVVPYTLLLMLGGLWLVIAFMLSILRVLWVDRMIVKRICNTMTLSNPEWLDRIGQSTAPIPRAGEGMADAFDIGAF